MTDRVARSALSCAPAPDSSGEVALGVTFHPFAPWLEHTFDVVLGTVLMVEIVLMFGNTAMRTVFNNSLVWANEVAEYVLTALAFIGGAIAYHREMHMLSI